MTTTSGNLSKTLAEGAVYTLFSRFRESIRLFNVSRIFKMQVYGVDLRPRYVRDKLMKLDECEAASKMKGIPLLVDKR